MKQLSSQERNEVLGLLKDRREAAIEAINADDPGWRKRIADKATKIAVGRLKIEKELMELEDVEQQINLLETKREELNLKIKKKMPLKERDRYDSCPTPRSLCEAIGEIVEEVEASIMVKDPAGQRLLQVDTELRAAKEKLVLCNYREELVEKDVLSSS